MRYPDEERLGASPTSDKIRLVEALDKGGHVRLSDQKGYENELDWDHASNSRNPYHWSLAKKIYHTFFTTALAFEIVFATSITVPAAPLIAREFSASRTAATLPLTLYVLGLAFGPLLVAPLSEIFGRRYINVITCFFLLAFIAGAGAAHNLATLLVCHFLAGLLGSAGIAIGAGSLVDIWPPSQHAGATIFYILAPFLGPTLGPIAGTFTLHYQNGNWRWTQWVILIIGAPIFIGLLFTSETKKEQILNPYKLFTDRSPMSQVLHDLGPAALRPIKMLFTDMVVFLLTLYTAFAYAMIFGFFASASHVLPRYYGFTPQQVGLSFISVIIGYIIVTLVFLVFDYIFYAKARDAGEVSPKHRLYAALIGSVFLPAGLFWYAWQPREGGNWASTVASGIFMGIGSFSLFISTITYLLDAYRAGAAASALAANGTLRYTFGATIPLFTVQMYEKLGVHWAGSVFAFLSVALLPIPWLLFKYGDGMMGRGKYNTIIDR